MITKWKDYTIRQKRDSILIYLTLITIICLVSYPVIKIGKFINTPDVFMDLSRYMTWAMPTFWINLFNTILIASLRALLVIAVSITGGYALAKFEFPFKRVIFAIVIFSITIPDFLIIIPLLKLVSSLGWTNSIWGLIIPSAGNGLGILLIRQYLVNYLTDDLIHAAMIDGASQMRIILQILIPLVKPAIILLVIKTGIEAWNEYLKPLVFLTDKSKMTVQIIISSSFGLGDQGAVLMAVYISLIPLLLLFLFASKQIIANITTGSIKY